MTGDYSRTVRVSDGSDSSTQPFKLIVQREDATVSEIGPNAIMVDDTQNSDRNVLTVQMTVDERLFSSTTNDGEISKTLNSGNGLANAKTITVTLTPVGTGSSYTCTANNTAYIPGDDDSATTSCDVFNVKVNVYEVNATIGGSYFTGNGVGVITVMDPALGFTTGGGFFKIDGGETKVNFGFNAKILKSGQVQGSSLTIFNRRNGNYVVKSNATYGLAVTKDGTGAFYTATFTGKATYAVPVSDPLLYCGARKCGDYRFTVYVEDRKEPGAGIDRYWIETKYSNVVVPKASLSPGAVASAVTIIGGNIQVPQPQSTG